MAWLLRTSRSCRRRPCCRASSEAAVRRWPWTRSQSPGSSSFRCPAHYVGKLPAPI